MKQTKAELKAQGKRNKAAGAKFEKKVREHYEAKGWLVTKWRNNIENGEIIQARNYYIPGRGNVMGSGFPDFVVMKKMTKPQEDAPGYYELMFIEAKLNGLLSKEEKDKLKILTDLGHKCYIAYFDDQCENNIRLREFIYTEGKEKIPRGHNENTA